MNRQKEKVTALYSRISCEDDTAGESGSITNQKAMLESYAEKNGFLSVAHFSDDGFSGKNFERPDWKRMIEEIENGNIGTVIVKDMSRVGRNYLQTGYFTEMYFQQKDVRFIAISNGIDSLNSESSEFAPFLNIMSEWQLRDISRKIKAGKKAIGMSGKRLTPKPIYGYKHDPDDKSKWIVDEEAAEVVRRIYALAVEGKGAYTIAKILRAEKVERPAHHQYTRGIINYSSFDFSTPYKWHCSAVTNILEKPEYLGHTVNFRSYNDSYKDKTRKLNDKEDWVIFENTHPAIVDKETWETVQKCRRTVRRTDTFGEANPLTGLMFCSDCGAKMHNHRRVGGIPTKDFITGRYYPSSPHDSYQCSKNKFSSNFSEDRKCTLHHISTKAVRQLVLETISNVSKYAVADRDEFEKRVRSESALQQSEAAKDHKKRLSKEQKRINELHTMIRKIYEDNVNGKINDKRFEILSSEYEQEQEELEKSVIMLQAEIDSFNKDELRVEQFFNLVQKYTEFAELTPVMLNEFIEKIVVHEADKSSGERVQQVDIHLNFIGKIDVPAPELTPEEIEAEEKARRKRINKRGQNYRHRLKHKQKREAMAAMSA